MREGDIDTSWNFKANPENTPWVIGYRFAVRQASQTSRRRFSRMRPRRYWVRFEIDQDGHVRWTGGVKATAATLAEVESMYAECRPGSNR